MLLRVLVKKLNLCLRGGEAAGGGHPAAEHRREALSELC